MPSPYIRRRQLAAEIRKLRESHGLTTDALANLMYYPRSKISRLENAQGRPDLAEIMNMLNLLEITGGEYDRLIKLAHEAAQKGWWDRYGMSMGPRQKLYADLEYSADSVCEYNQTAMPAVLHAPEFVAALIRLDECQGKLDYIPERLSGWHGPSFPGAGQGWACTALRPLVPAARPYTPPSGPLPRPFPRAVRVRHSDGADRGGNR